jgi:hypothetical protein
MPLLDHFHPPLEDEYPWDPLHSGWATRLADLLNDRWLPPQFIAAEHTHVEASLEIDVPTFAKEAVARGGPRSDGGGTVTLTPEVWTPPTAEHTIPALFPDTFEVRIFQTRGGRTLVGAIELISPGNKDRADKRQVFAAKCASYLHQGVSLLLIDIVTDRRANLHNETMRLMNAPAEVDFRPDVELYAAAYRPVLRQEHPELDIWKAPCAVGQPLPVLPLRLTGDLFVPVDFENLYRSPRTSPDWKVNTPSGRPGPIR